jgi:hypothetical protein
MENIPTPTPIPAVATPTPTPNVAPPTPMVANPTPTVDASPMPMSNGGSIGSSNSSFFKNINILEVMFLATGLAAMLYVIRYYRFKLKEDKMINNELQKQIDELKLNMQTNLKSKYKSFSK